MKRRSASGALLGSLFLGFAASFTGCSGPDAEGLPEDSPRVSEASNAFAAERAEVTQLAFDFMEALSARDTARLNELMAPHAALFSIREAASGPAFGIRTREEFLGGLADGGPDFLERIWEPTVEVTGRIGMVWAPYDFHSDGVFSHCGVDVLAFLKMAEGWKVTSVTYNVVREGCPDSPLGAPGG